MTPSLQTTQPAGVGTVLPLSQIHDYPRSPRRDSPNELQPLFSSVTALGQITPLRVRRLESGAYEPTDGHRLLAVLRLAASYGTIPNCSADNPDDTLIPVTIVEDSRVDAMKAVVTAAEAGRPLSNYEKCLAIVAWWDEENLHAKRDLSSRDFGLISGVSHDRAAKARKIATGLREIDFESAGFVDDKGTLQWGVVHRISFDALLEATRVTGRARSQILQNGVMPERDHLNIATSGIGAPEHTSRATHHENRSRSLVTASTLEEADTIRAATLADADEGRGVRLRLQTNTAALSHERALGIAATAEGLLMAVAPKSLPANVHHRVAVENNRMVILIGSITALRENPGALIAEIEEHLLQK